MGISDIGLFMCLEMFVRFSEVFWVLFYTKTHHFQDSARSDQPYKSFTNWLTFQNLVRGQIFGPLVLLDEEAESLRYFFGAKLHASTLREKYERRFPRALKCCIKKVTINVTELPEIPNDLPGESEFSSPTESDQC